VVAECRLSENPLPKISSVSGALQSLSCLQHLPCSGNRDKRATTVMQWRSIIRLLGILVTLYSLSFLPSIVVSLLYHDHQLTIFATSFLITLVAGLLLWLLNYHERD
jgi:hypothetical protein